MGIPLKFINPNRTKEVLPDTELHGTTILAFDERYGDFVEVRPEDVRSKPRIFQFWIECRRRVNLYSKPDRRKP